MTLRLLKNILSVLLLSALLFSCASTKSESVNSEEDLEKIDEEVESIESVFVDGSMVPIIEICPPPYGVPSLEEKKETKPGESYDNLLQPVLSEDYDGSLIQVTTNVSDVKVSLNNYEMGNENIKIINVIPRIYILGISKEGYKEENLFISVAENKKQVFHVELEKL